MTESSSTKKTKKRKDDTMTQIMTAAEMTDEQIEKAVKKLRDEMYKYRSTITFDVAQQVLGVENLGMMMFSPFRERVEAVSNLIVRKVPVNRSRTRQEAIDATGRAQYRIEVIPGRLYTTEPTRRVQYTNYRVVDEMPTGEGDEAEVMFFKPDLSLRNGFISDDDLDKECKLHGFKPADPISVAAVNEADPAFADEKPHGTYWKDARGNWCYAAFNRYCGERRVMVDSDASGWNSSWWIAVVRK